MLRLPRKAGASLVLGSEVEQMLSGGGLSPRNERESGRERALHEGRHPDEAAAHRRHGQGQPRLPRARRDDQDPLQGRRAPHAA